MKDNSLTQANLQPKKKNKIKKRNVRTAHESWTLAVKYASCVSEVVHSEVF